MQAEGLLFASSRQVEDLESDEALRQVANVACLPGTGRSLDRHARHPLGLRFPDRRGGGLRPEGGCRLARRRRLRHQLRRPPAHHTARRRRRAPAARASSPTRCSPRSRRASARPAPTFASTTRRARPGPRAGRRAGRCEMGFGRRRAISRRSRPAAGWPAADPAQVSKRARERGRDQLGTLGSGNHFVEVGWVDEVHDETAAEALGLQPGRVTVLDPHRLARARPPGLRRPPRRDARGGAPVRHRAARPAALLRAARQPRGPAPTGRDERRGQLRLRQPAAHRPPRAARLRADLRRRPGGGASASSTTSPTTSPSSRSTRSGPAAEGLRPPQGRDARLSARPPRARARLPGARPAGARARATWGATASCSLGTARAGAETFASCCHGAGRRLSRNAARREARPRDLVHELERKGILVRAASRATVDEEMPDAYKDVAGVVDVVDGAGIGRKVARLRPLAVVKG